MDVLAHPAYSEPFGLSIVEGMALGKPVVASDSGGPLEIIEDSTSGVLFRTGDASALAESLCRLLGDQQAAALIGAACTRAGAELLVSAICGGCRGRDQDAHCREAWRQPR